MNSLLNYETVKFFVKERHEIARFENGRSKLRQAFLSVIRSWRKSALLQNIIVTCGLVAAMIMAARDVAAGHMRVGDYVLINTYLLQVFLPLGGLGAVYIESKRAFVDMEAMLRLLDITPDIIDVPGAPTLKISGGEVRFENVRFAYDPAREILKGVSFTAPAGKRIAIVGATGPAKARSRELLFRFYDATGGRILIDGQDISRVTQNSLRAAIGVVPQETVLFNDTIYYNIAYGSLGEREPDRTEVERAASHAHIHDFIVSLPRGYETRVGERG